MMKKLYLTFALLLITVCITKAQFYTQYFDGADTSATHSIKVKIDTGSTNIWQVGRPRKTIFNRAASTPNVIITDTVNYYPNNNVSRFTLKSYVQYTNYVFALQWMQKLDMDLHHDGGTVEYSVDTAHTWHNVFNDPNVYRFMGFQPNNKDTLQSGEYAFSGRDTNWRNIWLCFDINWLANVTDTIYFRFTFKSDSINNNKEGWMIDNFWIQNTFIHPVKEITKKDYLNVFPNPTTGVVNVEILNIKDFKMIEHMEFINSAGKIIRRWDNISSNYWFDTSQYAEGTYLLKIKTNSKSSTFPIIVKRK